jgi:SAM-dependent methyltransferase
MNAGQRFARLATDLVVRRPALWRLFRGPIRRQFDRIAPSWDAFLSPTHLAPFERALEEIPRPPRRALDLGTGTGAAALAIARRWPDAEVVGVDLAEGMLEEARRKLPVELAERVRFVSADASALPFPDESFELVGLSNMIPFFDELARVTAAGGHVVFAFSGGQETPIYVPPERLRNELERTGFGEFREVSAGRGNGFLARKLEVG